MSTAVRSFFSLLPPPSLWRCHGCWKTPSLDGGTLAVLAAILGVVAAAVVEWAVLKLPLRFERH
jgi:hypothetical protein